MSDTNSKMSGTNFIEPDTLSGTPVKVIFRLAILLRKTFWVPDENQTCNLVITGEML